MERETQVAYYPVFPTKWAEKLQKETVSEAEQLVERIYTLQPDPQGSPTDSGSVRPSQANVFPPRDQVFRALDLTPPESVRVVLLGQDPYPTPGHANGLAFSVNPHIHPFPRSLQNIFKEYTDCFPYPIPTSGDLTTWAERGVLLLNAALTYQRDGKGAARRGAPQKGTARKSTSNPSKKNWTPVTDAILRACLQLEQPVVFLLWGGDAQRAMERVGKVCGVDVKQIHFTDACNAALYPGCSSPVLSSEIACHLESLLVETAGEGKFLLRSSHPSPLGAANPCGDSPPFLGSRPFLRANALLGELAINWQLP